MAYWRQKGKRPRLLHQIKFDEDALTQALETVQSEQFGTVLFVPKPLAKKAHLYCQDDQAAHAARLTALAGDNLINDLSMLRYPGLGKRFFLGDIMPPQLQDLNVTLLTNPSELGSFGSQSITRGSN